MQRESCTQVHTQQVGQWVNPGPIITCDNGVYARHARAHLSLTPQSENKLVVERGGGKDGTLQLGFEAVVVCEGGRREGVCVCVDLVAKERKREQLEKEGKGMHVVTEREVEVWRRRGGKGERK